MEGYLHGRQWEATGFSYDQCERARRKGLTPQARRIGVYWVLKVEDVPAVRERLLAAGLKPNAQKAARPDGIPADADFATNDDLSEALRAGPA